MDYISKTIYGGLFALLVFVGCNNSNDSNNNNISTSTTTEISLKLNSEDFQTTINSEQTNLFVLENKQGMKVAITNYGARIVAILAPDRKGHFENIVLGYNSLSGYLEKPNYYFGAMIGRYANRIADGKFTLSGKQYAIPTNDGPNALHGGPKGFDSQVWDAKKLNKHNLLLTYVSEDGEMGFPGRLKIQVLYTLRANNSLRIQYTAVTNEVTVVNFTNHSYFNLSGPGSGKITDAVLMINADQYTPIDSSMIPTGQLKPVKGTPFDFTQPTPIGQRINKGNRQLTFAGGYDHNWVLNKPKAGMLTQAARVYDPESGRQITVYTTEPGIQIYTGNFLDGNTSGIGGTYNYRSAFTLETQHFPDTPNQSNFPSTLLKPGEIYRSITIFKFGIHKK